MAEYVERTWVRAAGCHSAECPEVSFCESNACTETSFAGGGVYIRDSERPDEVVFLSKQGWRDLLTIQAPEHWL